MVVVGCSAAIASIGMNSCWDPHGCGAATATTGTTPATNVVTIPYTIQCYMQNNSSEYHNFHDSKVRPLLPPLLVLLLLLLLVLVVVVAAVAVAVVVVVVVVEIVVVVVVK